MSRITPDAEKNHFDAPMKSNVIGLRGFARARAPTAAAAARELRIESRIAWVASTAVNSETSVPMPSTKAKPFTPAVARMKRMKATRSVTTFASTIVEKPFL